LPGLRRDLNRKYDRIIGILNSNQAKIGAARENALLTRRHLLRAGLFSGCTACAALAAGRHSTANTIAAVPVSKISGAGYELSFAGSQRQTIMTGDRAAHLDLRSLKGQPHLYGVGPIEGLTGEVTIANKAQSSGQAE